MRFRDFRAGRGLSLLATRSAALALASVLAATPAVLAGQTPQALPVPAPKAEKPAELPPARSIIDRHVQAIGGRKAVLAHTSLHATGTMTVTGSGITGVLHVYGAKPNKSLVKIGLGGIGDLLEGFDGTTGWTLNPVTGPMLAQGKELEEKKFDADFYSDLRESGRYVSMKTVEKTTFEGRPCYKLSLVRQNGAEDFDYYDVETSLKAGATGTRESPMGPLSVTQAHSDYKKFGDLLMPTTMKQTAMGVQQVLTITSVEFDNVPPSTFEPPAQIKALLK
jgi:hypothetical protein